MPNTEKILSMANEMLVKWVWSAESTRPEPNRLDVMLTSAEDLVPMAAALRVKRLGYLAAITGYDLGEEAGQIEVLYHFCTGEAVVTLRLRVPREGGSVPRLSDLIPSAEVFERELSEMLGVTIVGLQAPKHLYLPDDWPEAVYPLRKDFDPQTPEAQM